MRPKEGPIASWAWSHRPLGCRKLGLEHRGQTGSAGPSFGRPSSPSSGQWLRSRADGAAQPGSEPAQSCMSRAAAQPLSLRPAVSCFWADGTVPQMAVTIPIRYKTPVNLLRRSGPQQAGLPRCFWGRKQEASLPCLFGRIWTANSGCFLGIERWRRRAMRDVSRESRRTQRRPMSVMTASCSWNFNTRW